MPCPRCGSTHITEEYKLVVCTDCGNVLDDSRLQAEGPQLGAPDEAPAAAAGAEPHGAPPPQARD